jgi:ribulose 1,5-bisphosphate synthetase/thiazole synthase
VIDTSLFKIGSEVLTSKRLVRKAVEMEAQKAKRVAIIGAGISGVTTAAHLKNAGIEVTVFERNRASGGSW